MSARRRHSKGRAFEANRRDPDALDWALKAMEQDDDSGKPPTKENQSPTIMTQQLAPDIYAAYRRTKRWKEMRQEVLE